MNLLSQTATDPNSSSLLWGFILIGVAIFLIGLELVVPSGGILGVLAAALLIGSLAAFFSYSAAAGFAAVAALAILGPLLTWVVWRWWSGTTMARRFVLEEEVEGHVASAGDTLLHRTGTTETDLRPIGTVCIDDRRLDALSEQGVIPAGVTIEVIQVLDNQVKVRRVKTDQDNKEKTT
jgi:membrane-bound serine protease (ClpP class)